MDNVTKFKAFQTRLEKFILNKLGGTKINDSSSTFSRYYRVFSSTLRISDHMNRNNTSGRTFHWNIICPMFSHTDIVVICHNVIYVVHSEAELKHTLMAFALFQQYLNSLPQMEESVNEYKEFTDKIQEGVLETRALKTIINNLANIVKSNNTKMSLLDFKTPIKAVRPVSENPHLNGWGKAMKTVIIDYSIQRPSCLEDLNTLVSTYTACNKDQKLRLWEEFKNKHSK